MRNIVITVFLFILFALHTSSSLAQETTINSPSESYIKEQYEFLKDQTMRFEDRIQDEREALSTMTSLVLSIIGVLITVVTAVGFASYWGTLRAVESKAEKKLQKKLDAEMASFNTRIEDWAKDTMFDNLGMSKKILFIAREQDHEGLREKEIRLLKERGFKNIELSSSYRVIDNLGMIVFCYKDDFNETLTATVGEVIRSEKETPILGYYHTTIVNEALGHYDWKAYANSPLSLMSWVFTILSSSKKNI